MEQMGGEFEGGGGETAAGGQKEGNEEKEMRTIKGEVGKGIQG